MDALDDGETMKRSEMLGKIASVIINYNEADCIINRDKAMNMAETILYIQEEAGMLPPPDYTETYYSGDEPGGYNPNFWEDEK